MNWLFVLLYYLEPALLFFEFYIPVIGLLKSLIHLYRLFGMKILITFIILIKTLNTTKYCVTPRFWWSRKYFNSGLILS